MTKPSYNLSMFQRKRSCQWLWSCFLWCILAQLQHSTWHKLISKFHSRFLTPSYQMENFLYVFSLHIKTIPRVISHKNYSSCTHVFSPVLLVQYDSWGSSVSRNIYKVWKITNTNSTTHRHRAWPPAGRKALSKKNLKLLAFLSANIRITQWHSKRSVVGQCFSKTIFF